MVRLRQIWKTDPITDVQEAVSNQIKSLHLDQSQLQDKQIAITAGSRGIANLQSVLTQVVHSLQAIGARPFIVPAMGSHGGATAKGQKEVLAHYGITEATIGAPVRASMAVDRIGTTDMGLPVYIDRHAAGADGIVVVNRVKPHTEFKAPVESGLMKMLAIGLGKQQGAEILHRAVIQHGYYPIIASAARVIMAHSPILFGLALVENQRDETQIVKAFKPENIESGEERLLILAKELMPKIPFDRIDLLIVDRMGKDISGTGMDPNIIGRPVSPFASAPDNPRITRILVRDLTDASQGNADGIGLADFTTRRLVEKMNQTITYIGATTGGAPEGAKIPIYYDTDRQAIDVALKAIGWVEPEEARVVRIENTLQLESMLISAPLIHEIDNRPDLEVGPECGNMAFDKKGNLI